jgi:hypothetical protein
MSFLSTLLPIIGIVGAIATGGALGIVAGALLATSLAAQHGLLGGGLKNFFDSGIGQGLTMAVGLASAATGIYNAATSVASTANTADIAATGDAMQSQTADQLASSVSQQATVAGTDADDAAVTTSAYPDAPNQAVAQSMQGTAGGLLPEKIASANGLGISSIPGASVDSPPVTSNVSMAVGDEDIQADVSAASNGPTPGSTGAQAGAAASGGSGTGPAAQAGAAADNSDDLSPVDTSKAVAQGQVNDAAAASNEAQVAGGSNAPQGFLGKAGAFLKGNSMVAMAGGQALAGLGQGVMQEKATEQQIAAQEFAQRNWENPTLTAAFENAAAAPINVPQGYLQRAAAVRSMISGSPNGPAGTPAPSAPAPQGQAVAPVGMGGSPGGGPVPVLGMNAAPRGGVV